MLAAGEAAKRRKRVTPHVQCTACLFTTDEAGSDEMFVYPQCKHAVHLSCMIEHFFSHSAECPLCRGPLGLRGQRELHRRLTLHPELHQRWNAKQTEHAQLVAAQRRGELPEHVQLPGMPPLCPLWFMGLCCRRVSCSTRPTSTPFTNANPWSRPPGYRQPPRPLSVEFTDSANRVMWPC